MNARTIAAIVLVTVLAGYPAVEAQTTPQPQTTPEPRTAPVPPTEPREPAERAVPAEGRPLTPSGTDVLSPPRTDFLSRLLAGVEPGEELLGWYVIPSFSLSEIYDDNIFGRSGRRSGDTSSGGRGSGKAGDFITQASPGLAAGYESPRFRLLGGYKVDGQWYADHSELNSAAERQVGRLEFGYVPTLSLQLTADASYEKGKNTVLVPQETRVIAVDVGRRELSVYSVSSSALYQFAPLTSVRATYAFTRSELSATADASSSASQDHNVTLGVSRELSPLDRATLSYGFSFFETQEATGRTTSTFHSIRVEYARDFSQDSGFRLGVGPRFSGGDVGVDGSAQLRQTFRFATVYLDYSRSQTIVVGLTGPQTTDTLAASIAFDPIGSVSLNLASSVSRSSATEGRGGATETVVYGANATVRYRLGSRASVLASYQFSLTDNTDRISRHVVTIGVDFSYPVRVY